jgi:NitT/TauT family transport system permease protein/sulfonate transport system permease protein
MLLVEEMRKKPSAMRHFPNFLGTFLSLGVFLGAWEWLCSSGLIDNRMLPPPTAVAISLAKEWDRVFFEDAMASLQRVLIGYAVGSFAGLGAGILLLSTLGKRVLRPLIEMFRPIPPIAWIPLALLWFGIGDRPAYFLVALGAFFPAASGTETGFQHAETAYSQAARSLGMKRGAIFRQILLPQAAPALLSGLRIGLGVSWMIVVTAELVGAQSGLGYLIQISRAQLQTELVIGGMVTIGLIGFMLSHGMSKLEKWLLPWRQIGRQAFSD